MAENYYLKALSICQGHGKQPDCKDESRAVYQRLIGLAHDSGDHAKASRYQRLLDSIDTKRLGQNDSCLCGTGKKHKKCCGRDVSTVPQLPPFAPRVVERHLLALRQSLEGKNFDSGEEINKYVEQMNKSGKAPHWTPETPLEKAQDLIYEAFEAVGKKRTKLAEQALKISADCADAYVLLAEEKAQDLEEALGLYAAGMKAGERTLGGKVFKEGAGCFWGIIETRPYMRARAGLAQCLWLMGKQEEAVSHYRELLRLNPNDNQGIRYLLAVDLLEMEQIDALEQLMGQYDEPTAAWLYTKALIAYIKQGDRAEACKLLKEALGYNPHVVSYLLGEKKLPRELPDRIGFGDKDEAVVYAAEFGPGWHQTRGAVDWLAMVSGKAHGTWQGRKKPAGVPEVFLRAFDQDNRGHRPKR